MLKLADDVVIINIGAIVFRGATHAVDANEAVVHQPLGIF
jgi:ABC-type branched-subunit amino acid transport system ATPase component